MSEYVGGKKASQILGVHQRTLYNWEKKGYIDTIRTNGGKRLYNIKKYLNVRINKNNINKLKICYVRVSSNDRKIGKKYSNGKIIILNKKIITNSREEIVEDVLQIMNVFVAKINGLRKYKI